jgi:hypothetical protein
LRLKLGLAQHAAVAEISELCQLVGDVRLRRAQADHKRAANVVAVDRLGLLHP